MIIGVDHGYADVKTPNFVFAKSVVTYEKEPPFMHDTVLFGGKYYCCGGERDTLIKDKTSDESYYILTLLAIAKELELRNGGDKTIEEDIDLAVGLPIQKFSSEKEKFIDYLKRPKLLRDVCPVRFIYNRINYTVRITDVHVYPQGYSAIVNKLAQIKEPVIICDIGSWTVDVMQLNEKGVPEIGSCVSLEYGVSHLISGIQKDVFTSHDNNIKESLIESVLKGTPNRVSADIVKTIESKARDYCKEIRNRLIKNGFDLDNNRLIYIGGGANIVSKYSERKIDREDVIGDVRANAIGYELITKQKLNG